ncbi:hypothetical protein [Xanthobacter aminoxidans]|uniref:hypothetical protein n=1 Tax=Xanthobacter aminoxidans TaxID=186280 RepID=UPI0020230B41|nr:hypothetical protein [Xanthobacter aminoxidans]
MAEITNELLIEVPKSIPQGAALGARGLEAQKGLEAREEVIARRDPRQAFGQDMNTIYGMHAGRDARLARIERRLGLVGIH